VKIKPAIEQVNKSVIMSDYVYLRTRLRSAIR